MVRLRLKMLIVGSAIAMACSSIMPANGTAFEVAPGSFTFTTSSDQAGAHADVSASFTLAQKEGGGVGALLRSAEVVAPLGFAGYPPNVKICDPVQLQLEVCPMDAQVGTIEIVLRIAPGDDAIDLQPLYNMAPAPNETAVYGFVLSHDFSGNIVVHVGSDYRAHLRATNVPAGPNSELQFEFLREAATVWGVPADLSHDAQRGNGFTCTQHGPHERFVPGGEVCEGGGAAANENVAPYLVNPTQCTGESLTAELRGVESWDGETAPLATANVGPFTGCESLKFAPTIALAPEVSQATSPTGYEFDLRVPQIEGAEGLATADLKDAVVRMPKGVVLSPSAATGLESCSETQVGLHTEQQVECPNASKLGTVSIVTPALTGELKGSLFLGGPAAGPITGPPFTVYLTFAGHGVNVKIRGTVTPDPSTGQLTTTFDENPELPFSELKLHLNGGSRATVANPSACGSYFAESDLTPWSTPYTPDATPSSSPFEVTGCGEPRFSPVFEAGTASNQAGGYSPLAVTFSRGDADQDLRGLTVTTPPGLSGNLSKIPLCPEPQAAQGICPDASLIGEVTADAGPGPEPVFIKGGKVYLTGPYDGAPFGLLVDVSEHAGPIDLGTGPCDCEVVRATVSVDPKTAQLTVTNGALPTIKDGVPFQVRTVSVNINRPEFVFNPTSCAPMSVNATLSSTQGMVSRQAYHFQVTNCAALAFKPTFKVSTSGRTTKSGGASLIATLTYPKAVFGSQANIAQVKVDLPRALPSRLTTLQKACTAGQFEKDPGGCPSASIVGYARAVTPILPVALEGPAYFVSHGGEAFPSLIVVLQGYGVTVDLVGTTFISKKGITSSTFKTVPDVPVGSFQLVLPQGRYSALAANGNLCKSASKLLMPTKFVAQDGAVLEQETKIRITGCPPARPKAKKAKVKHHKKHGKGKKK